MALKSNIVIDQGTDYTVVVDVTTSTNSTYDLTNYTANAQIRKHYSSSNSVSFSTTVNSSDGTLTLSLSASQTANIISGRYVYDVNITSASNTVTRVLEGIATITPRVTR